MSHRIRLINEIAERLARCVRRLSRECRRAALQLVLDASEDTHKRIPPKGLQKSVLEGSVSLMQNKKTLQQNSTIWDRWVFHLLFDFVYNFSAVKLRI